MNLLPNSPINMDYDPSTDILAVEYPDLDEFMLPAIQNSLTVMVEAIRSYDVKKLLLDASKSAIRIGEEENRKFSLQFAEELAKTRIIKVARIQPLDPVREQLAQNNISQMQQSGMLPYQLRTFSSREDAMRWLREMGDPPGEKQL